MSTPIEFTPIIEFKPKQKVLVPSGYAARQPNVDDIKMARDLMYSMAVRPLTDLEHDFISHVEGHDIIGILLARIDELTPTEPKGCA